MLGCYIICPSQHPALLPGCISADFTRRSRDPAHLSISLVILVDIRVVHLSIFLVGLRFPQVNSGGGSISGRCMLSFGIVGEVGM